MKKYFLTIVTILVLLCSVLAMSSCNSYGIPDGGYEPCDKDGVFLEYKGTEYCFAISNKKAEYLYNKYKIIEIDGSIFFEFSISQSEELAKYKAEYDKSTKILTIYMPTKHGGVPKPNGEEIPFYFKKD